MIFGTRLLNLRDGSWLWFIGLSIQLLDTHLASEDGNCLVQHHLEGPSGATCACIARVPLAKISFSPQLMLACVFVVNRQLKRVGKALYKLKNTKQVLAIIMHQTLMHSQTPQGISTWCLEPYPCASQVREVMNVDSQAKDRNFILCVFCLLCAYLRSFFFPTKKKNFFSIQSQAKTWQFLLMNHLSMALFHTRRRIMWGHSLGWPVLKENTQPWIPWSVWTGPQILHPVSPWGWVKSESYLRL